MHGRPRAASLLVGLWLVAGSVSPALAAGGKHQKPVAAAPVAAPSAAAPPAAPEPVAAPAPVLPTITVAAPARPSPTAGVLADRVVAVVNDDVILLSEVYAFKDYIEGQAAASSDPAAARSKAEHDVVDRILQQRLVAQEVTRLHLEVSEQEIDRNIDEIAQRNGMDRDQLKLEVQKEMTWEQYRAELAKGLQEQKFGQSVLRPRINITEDELKDAFIRETQDAPQVAHVQAIFLSWPVGGDEAAKAAVRTKAAEVIKLAATGDFAALSKQYDEGPFGAAGGEMGKFKAGELVGPLDAAMQATATGGISAPIETPQGIFLLKVADRTAGANDFEAMRPKLEEAVFQSRMADEQERWFEQAKRQAAIRILL